MNAGNIFFKIIKKSALLTAVFSVKETKSLQNASKYKVSDSSSPPH